MPWAAVSIENAIRIVKTTGAIFVVYVEDDTRRTALHNIVESPHIKDMLKSSKFVAVRITSSSESYRHFVSIYQLVPIPSIFFIGSNGWPLEIIGGELSEEDIIRRISALADTPSSVSSADHTPSEENLERNEVIEKCTVPEDNNETLSSREEEDSMELPELLNMNEESMSEVTPVQLNSDLLQSEEPETCLPSISKPLAVPVHLETATSSLEEDNSAILDSAATVSSITSQTYSPPTVAKDSELKVSQLSSCHNGNFPLPSQISNTLQRPDAVRKQFANEEKQKAEHSTERFSQGASSENATFDDTVYYCRVQFRMPDGSSHTHTFSSKTSIKEVREYVVANINLPYKEFSMSTGYPRFELTEGNVTLVSLNMIPTAVILINPVLSVTTPSYFFRMKEVMWFIICQPFSAASIVFTNVYLRLFGRGNANRPENVSSEQTSGRHSPEARNPAPGYQSGGRRQRIIQREGNVYRLSNRSEDSDDENNTWNGNSTQQM